MVKPGQIVPGGTILNWAFSDISRGLKSVDSGYDATPINVWFRRKGAETTLSQAANIDNRTLTITDPTGFVNGTDLSVRSNVPAEELGLHFFSFFLQIGAPAANVITIDSPVDHAFPLGSVVTPGDRNLAINGAASPEIVSVTNPIATPFDIMRLIYHVHTPGKVGELADFGHVQGGLTNGVVLQYDSVETGKSNIYNLKNNRDFILNCWDIHLTEQVDGENGFFVLDVLGDLAHHGAVLRLEQHESIHLYIQDDLTSLTKFEVLAQGRWFSEREPI